jgi:S-adenosylmethionine/arginine decarboxylase-like enzyme
MFKNSIEYICENNLNSEQHKFAEEVNIDYEKGSELLNNHENLKNIFSDNNIIGQYIIIMIGAHIIDNLFMKNLQKKYDKRLLKKIYYKQEIKRLKKLYDNTPSNKRDVKQVLKDRLETSKQNLRNL